MGCFCSVTRWVGRCLVSPSAVSLAFAVRSGLLARAMSLGDTTVRSRPKGGASLVPESFHGFLPSGRWWFPPLVLQRVHTCWQFPLKLPADALVYQSGSCSWPSGPEPNLVLLVNHALTVGLFWFCWQRTLKQLWAHLCKCFLVIVWVFPPR